MNKIIKFLTKIKEIEKIIDDIRNAGGIPYLVGGSVRDLVLGCQVKDLDIEVHKLSVDNLETCLHKFGEVSLVGKQFGVLKLHGIDIDWSLPRKDSKGRKPIVVVDPELTIEWACRRRDVTMNAMAIDLGFVVDNFETISDISHLSIIDPYGGLEDIANKSLRVVDKELFVQDPLRFYRVMQFIGRFEMIPDAVLTKVCKKMDLRDITKGGELARERIYEEIKKLLIKSRRPSLGFRWLKDLQRLYELFPEVGVLVDVAQRADYHPEGDVFEHTMQTIDAAARLSIKDEEEKFMIMLGALCHDFGKAVCIGESGHARRHDVVGVPLTKTFLRRFTRNTFLIKAVCKLVRYHRMPLTLVEQKSSLKAYKRLATKLAPEVTAQQVYLIAWADIRGRNNKGHEPLEKGFLREDEEIEKFLKRIHEAAVEKGPEPPVLFGRHLLGIIEPGPKMGELLKKAYNIQIDEGIKDVEELKKRVLTTKVSNS